MRLLSHAANGADQLALATGEDSAWNVSDLLGDGSWTIARLLADPDTTLERLRAALVSAAEPSLRISSLTVLPPVPRPPKIIAVGRNYRAHAAEEAADLPQAPLLFAKLPSALVGDGATISWPAGLTSQVDYEAELAVVIGRRVSSVDAEHALDYVLGYSCLNDVSARDLQVTDGQWTRAKGLDTFCPMGPWIVTADEIPNPAELRVSCLVNGELRQDAPAGDMIHGVAQLISFCSRAFTLEPGDIIATGTPGGVGAFREPPVYLADGDVVEVSIDRIGKLRNVCHIVT
jgi:2-keto-4-pentenoate hydratase/2-oxohepta-3-ene-1,7-dioic acid hydratase in catechol pathway